MPLQRCPGCGVANDVGIFVSGQRVRCASCGLPFTVQRSDSILVEPAEQQARRRARTAGGAVGMHPALRKKAASRAPGPAVRLRQRASRPPEPPKPPPIRPSPRPEPASGPKRQSGESDTFTGGNGLFIPGFEICEVIGKGGMGKVYRARQLSLDRLVAIKVLNEDLAKHRSFIKRFEKETASLAALSHPNITAIIDRGHVDNMYFFVMEYVDGVSLRHKINQGRMAMPALLDLFSRLCRAIDHAHQRGVIHRDLKPENVLFTSDGVLKVADFGLANILDAEGRWEMTRTKVSMGTVNYMAPEQRRDAKHVDRMADIYSLGVMLYELLAGELPLGRFEPPSRHRADCDPRLDKLVLRMLDFDPDKRPQRCELVAVTLDKVREELGRAPSVSPPVEQPAPPVSDPEPPEPPAPPVPAPVDPPRARPRRSRPLRRLTRRLALLVAGAALLVFAAAGVFWALLRSDLAALPGDLHLRASGSGLDVRVDHPYRVFAVRPVELGDAVQPGARYDFSASASLPERPVRFVGGSWDVLDGLLVQDTCSSELTVNQKAALAVFGHEPVEPEGWTVAASVRRRPALWDGRPVRAQLQETHVSSLLDVDTTARAGLGFVDEHGRGLLVLLPESGPGRIERSGALMEKESSEFKAPELDAGAHRLELSIVDGQLVLRVDDELLHREWAGFAMQAEGYPAVACQNARCEIRSLAYRKRAPAPGPSRLSEGR
ncbi:MAG: serine/threonine protein kinase [Deltaproteobacteria bacterium]|nr:serine/threonine protein kinase [Deltaproteobacteria bacterium]